MNDMEMISNLIDCIEEQRKIINEKDKLIDSLMDCIEKTEDSREFWIEKYNEVLNELEECG